MASDSSKYSFFQNLRTVAATVSNDIKEIERKMQNSKFELPENNATFKLIEICDDTNTHKNDSQAFLEQLCGENKKYNCYRKDVELLVDEMESSIDRVEEVLSGYGYQKYHCDQLVNTDIETSSKETLLTVTEEEQQSALQKTPVLADYGLTAKVPKYLPSALKDKQESAVKSVKKQVHFESPESQSEFKGKENRIPYSLQKTPLLEDYGLSSRKKRHVQGTRDSSRIKRQLNFQSKLGSPSKEMTYISDTDDTGDLLSSLNSALEKVHVGAPEVQSDTKLSTPEEPFLPYDQRIRFASERQNEAVTPEEPKLQPIISLGSSKTSENEEGTPEDPIPMPIIHLYEDAAPSTPKTPEFEPTSYMSFKNWQQPQKKK